MDDEVLDEGVVGELGLLDKGGDVNATQESETSALHVASENGHLGIVKSLIEKGADVNAKDRFDKTPLYLALEKGHVEIVHYLIGKGADVNSKDWEKKIYEESNKRMYT